MTTDLRQGLTPTQHAVLDELAHREPLWRMMQVEELDQAIERMFLAPPATGTNWPRIAAMALHLAERAGSAPAVLTDPAAAGYVSLYAADEEWGTTAKDLDPLSDALDSAEADALHPVLKVDAFHAPDVLFAVLVPTAFDEDGNVTEDQLQFHPTHQSALAARLRAMGEDAA